MKINFLVVASEILKGHTKDKNIHTLTKFLRKQGHTLSEVRIIQDLETDFKNAVKNFWTKDSLTIVSGGLGPTEDDKTKKFLSDFFEKPLISTPQSKKIARLNYSSKKRVYREKTKYHEFPKGFDLLLNSAGFAPGLAYEVSKNNSQIFAFPGVPSEFSAMLSHLEPKVSSNEETQINFRTFSLTESYIFSDLDPSLWGKLDEWSDISCLPKPGQVDLLLSFNKQNETKLRDIIKTSPISKFIWHEGFLEIEEVLLKMLRAKKFTLSIAESCTGGTISSKFTRIPGSSDVFLGGVTTYSNNSKTDLIQVKKDCLQKYGAVSLQTAEQMAKGCQQVFSSQVSISTTGIAGPTGGTDEKPIGTICIGVCLGNKVQTRKYQLPNLPRKILQEYFSNLALFFLYQIIKDSVD